MHSSCLDRCSIYAKVESQDSFRHDFIKDDKLTASLSVLALQIS